jgi:hypothetical protein
MFFKGAIKTVKRQPKMEEIFRIHISDNDLISIIYKKLF